MAALELLKSPAWTSIKSINRSNDGLTVLPSMESMKFFGRGFAGLTCLFLGICLMGCETTDSSYKYDPLSQNNQAAQAGTPAMSGAAPSASGDLLHVGDAITITFADLPTSVPPIDDSIKEDGSITLILNQKFQAAGKTIGALQADIRDRYVPQYFKYLTVSIKTADRFFSVGGEVRNPSRQAYTGYMTVTRGIDTAGGFTDFANKGRVEVTHANGEKYTVNCGRALNGHPELDKEVYPGDRIYVHKRWW
jgi:polysaccharide export outer membrane protein